VVPKVGIDESGIIVHRHRQVPNLELRWCNLLTIKDFGAPKGGIDQINQIVNANGARLNSLGSVSQILTILFSLIRAR
jgi:hypothetical protein